MRLTSPLIPFTYKGIRCTMISRQPIDGTELREMLLSMLLFATHVRESKPSIKQPARMIVTFASTRLKV
jgi:hypothetical protein